MRRLLVIFMMFLSIIMVSKPVQATPVFTRSASFYVEKEIAFNHGIQQKSVGKLVLLDDEERHAFWQYSLSIERNDGVNGKETGEAYVVKNANGEVIIEERSKIVWEDGLHSYRDITYTGKLDFNNFDRELMGKGKVIYSDGRSGEIIILVSDIPSHSYSNKKCFIDIEFNNGEKYTGKGSYLTAMHVIPTPLKVEESERLSIDSANKEETLGLDWEGFNMDTSVYPLGSIPKESQFISEWTAASFKTWSSSNHSSEAIDPARESIGDLNRVWFTEKPSSSPKEKYVFAQEGVPKIRVEAGNISEGYSVVKDLDVAPRVIDNKFYIPLRAVIVSLGGDVIWNPEAKSITVNYEQLLVTLKLEGESLKSKLLTKEGRTLISLSDLKQLLGVKEIALPNSNVRLLVG